MNKNRRQQLRKWIDKANVLKDELESIMQDEQESYDSIPENLQYSERANNSEEAINLMEEAIGLIDDAIDAVDEIN